MKRILLLCFIHGFKGNDNTFKDFPQHLEAAVSGNIPDELVKSVTYPKYETKGELAASTAAFLEWLKERVMELRKAHLSEPWPPNDRYVGVILIAHSMGGFVASDCLFRILDERRENETSSGPIFPLIQGILSFDTPYNGLARSMFVYGAFSNYQKVNNVFNVMTALGVVAPAGLTSLATLSRSGTGSATARSVSAPGAARAWKTWQLLAVRTGAVGAIAAGGVAAYAHRRQIAEGLRSVLAGGHGTAVAQSYQQGADALGQGLAYVNRGTVGASFAWLADHFTFVGALLKTHELARRLDRLASLRGVGLRDVYASLGENGMWSGGYFVPERTFCAVPAKDHPASSLFQRLVIESAADEVDAHISLFKPDKNQAYDSMTRDAARLVVNWFRDETDIYDNPTFAVRTPDEPAEDETIALVVAETEGTDTGDATRAADMPDESPLDITAAASLITSLPADIDNEHAGSDREGLGKEADERQKQAYMQYLFGIAQQTGTNVKSYLPSRIPGVDHMTMPSVPVPNLSMPSIPTLLSLSMPNIGSWYKKTSSTGGELTAEPVTDPVAEPGNVEESKEKLGIGEGGHD